jgi:23S rRNA (pseudouridine1915-N3)-methyltransferase
LTIRLLYVGKPRDPHANALAARYLERASRFARCEMREIKPRHADTLKADPAVTWVLLDPAGRPMDSAGFTRLVRHAELDARDLVFVVGGADGLPKAWKSTGALVVSLSPLTLPHELARVVVAEQIYRALATLRGHPYPR